jgi:hypothetical protein
MDPTPSAPPLLAAKTTAEYEDDDIAFQPPAEWREKIVAYSAAPRPRGIAPSVVLTRELLRATTLKGHVDSHLEALATRVRELRILDVRERHIAGRVAAVARVVRPVRGTAVEQAFVYIAPEAPAWRVTLLQVTQAHGATPDTLEQIVASIRFPPRRRASPSLEGAPDLALPLIPIPGMSARQR